MSDLEKAARQALDARGERMSTITEAQQKAITDLLVDMTLPAGLGTEMNACSIAAINLALSGRLTDDVPDCMSDVVGRWIIGVQDAMPAEMRNSARWKDLLPRAAGTGKMHEAARLAIILDWMWSDVLPSLQPIANSGGFGAAWKLVMTEKTAEAAWAANAAARAAKAAKAAAYAAKAAAWAAYAADAAANAAASAADVAKTAVWAADAAARAAADAALAAAASAAYAAKAAGASANAAARAAADAALAAAADAEDAVLAAAYAAAAARAAAWDRFDPCGLLQKLVEVSE